MESPEQSASSGDEWARQTGEAAGEVPPVGGQGGNAAPPPPLPPDTSLSNAISRDGTDSMQNSASVSPRTQRRIRSLQGLLEPGTVLLAVERGRANARLTGVAFGILVVFVAAFVALLVFEGFLLLPGVLLVYLFVNSIFPQRYLAVTSGGMVACNVSGWNDRPKAVLGTASQEAVLPPAAQVSEKKAKVAVGPDWITLRRNQYECLTEVVRQPPTDAVAGAERVRSSSGLLPTRRERAIVAGVAVLFVASVVVSANLRSSSNTGTSVNDSMNAWMASYGSNFTSVANDVAKVSGDSNQAPQGGVAEIRADCVKLGSDVGTAESYPPMPDAALRSEWSSILTDLHNGAQACQAYLNQPTNNAELNQFVTNLQAAGHKYLELLQSVNAG